MPASPKPRTVRAWAQRDKIIRMLALDEAALAVCLPCRLKKQLSFFANDEAYHPWDGYAMPCAASRIWVLYREASRS